LLLVLAGVAVLATGCFSSKVSDTTITNEITIGQGTAATAVNPEAGGSATTATTATTTTSTGTATTAASTATATTTSGGGSGADLAAGKTAFTATCGGCHALKDAGTNGQVGPDLDSFGTLTVALVAHQIANGGGPMPPKLLTGQDAANVAAYVASVAGKK
jgi:mono/diheme cytochrome c family protein